MSTIQYNVKDTTGQQRFITPIVTISVNGETKQANDSVKLHLAYIIKAIVDSAFNGTTLESAVEKRAGLILAMPKDAEYSVYMPTQYDDRESADITLWSLCATVTQPDMVKACNLVTQLSPILTPARLIMEEAEKQATQLVADAKVSKVNATQPVYYGGVVSKRAGGKVVNSLF